MDAFSPTSVPLPPFVFVYEDVPSLSRDFFIFVFSDCHTQTVSVCVRGRTFTTQGFLFYFIATVVLNIFLFVYETYLPYPGTFYFYF